LPFILFLGENIFLEESLVFTLKFSIILLLIMLLANLVLFE